MNLSNFQIVLISRSLLVKKLFKELLLKSVVVLAKSIYLKHKFSTLKQIFCFKNNNFLFQTENLFLK